MHRMWLIFHSQPTFFGLTDKYVEYVYEQFFYLKQYGGWSFIEAYNLPIQLREWWVTRIGKEFQKEKEEYEKAQRSQKSAGPIRR